MRRCLMDLRPTEFDHITATISLYRPGPMDFIPDFIACLHGEKQPEYVHKVLEPILSETMGVCVSGDALVTDARTGRRYRLDEVGRAQELVIQGIDAEWRPAAGRVTHWIDSGQKPVSKVTLRNGAQIKVTADHRLLTEDGWRPLSELQAGDYVATPALLLGPGADAGQAVDRRRLRILAYLIADGSLTSGTMVDFVSKDPAMLAEYESCLAAFEDVSPTYVAQVREVTRIGATKTTGRGLRYHSPNSLLAWLRELGLKHPAGSKPGGVHSRDKFIPDFVFELSASDIAFFLASLWDGDGYMGNKLCHYRTVSRRLAEDVQAILLRLRVSSTIHVNYYTVQNNGDGPMRVPSYQVTVYDTARLAELLQPDMISAKAQVACHAVAMPDISRERFMAELNVVWLGSQKGLTRATGFDHQHFRAKNRQRERIPASVVARTAQALDMPDTARRMNVTWQKIMSIEPTGVEHVYDLTVEGLHSFVANGIIVHNCVYQEQVIQILADVAGYTPGEADLVRRGISKKSKKTLDEHREIFAKGSAAESGLKRAEADAIWDALMGFARYGFNRAHAADYAVIVAQTAFLKAYYPVEYMAALLTIERHDTEKIGLLIAECRRMGIEVLPPNINDSSNNFTVEQLPSDRTAPRQVTTFAFPMAAGAAIRMGLDAIKNVGEGPVEAVLQARGGTPFKSLADFTDRCDLRKVNRRGLECLVKVGALDDFGERGLLLAAVDNILHASTSTHEAAEIGQMTLFGAEEVANEDILGGISPEARPTPKEILEWEKELVGVYVSSHPLQQMTVDLMNVITHNTVDVTEELVGKAVCVAGMIAEVRTITTKKGDTMAFARLEDLTGSVDVTVFPKLFKEQKPLWATGKIVVIYGKADVRNGRVSVVADSAQDYVDDAKIIEDKGSVAYRFRNGAAESPSRPQIAERPAAKYAPPAPRYTSAPSAGMAEIDDEDGGYFGDDNPFAAEEPEWLNGAGEQGSRGAEERRSRADEEQSRRPPRRSVLSGRHCTGVRRAPLSPCHRSPRVPLSPCRRSPQQPPVAASPESPRLPVAASPTPPRPRVLRLTFRRSQSLDADRKRLAELVAVLSKYEGDDRFEIVVEANSHARYQLDFPNNHTRICRELQGELTQRLGQGGWQIAG